jgi:hypothetical protein
VFNQPGEAAQRRAIESGAVKCVVICAYLPVRVGAGGGLGPDLHGS